ncbi:hypothetical protein KBD09_03135 [Candidatus Woesebacteria bacterium]|nr:hypothetical protein [Candidatus Woesebacteria bacterium]
MNKLHITVIAVLMAAFMLFTAKSSSAAACELVDPVQGMIDITCKNAHLTVSGDGVRYLPLPQDVSRNTKLTIDWQQPFTGNTIVASWDSDNQMSHFWQRINGVWTNNPDNAFMQEIGDTPHAVMGALRMPNGQPGWAVGTLLDLMIWNGGN